MAQSVTPPTSEYMSYFTIRAVCTGSSFDGTISFADNTAFRYTILNSWEASNSHGDSLEGTAIPAAGSTFTATLTPGRTLYKKTTVVTKKKIKIWSKTKTKKLTQSLTIRAGARPNRAEPYSNGECPSWAPIKGNHGSYDWIYHVPGSTYYSRTYAEECFTTEAAARRAGYRAPLR